MQKICTLFAIILFAMSIANGQTKIQNALKDPVVLAHTQPLSEQLKKMGLQIGSPIFIRIFKQTEQYPDYGELEVWVQQQTSDKKFVRFKSYAICYYAGGLGPKKKEGDCKTPEGFYAVTPNLINQYSNYHRAFNIGYPNLADRQKGYTGSAIMIHGSCVSIGCIAMTDPLIEEIWTLGILALANGQKAIEVHIFPFPITDANLQKYQDNESFSFWQSLRKRYNAFEQNQQVKE